MRLAVLADIHGNLPAVEGVIADMDERSIDAIVNLGDCVSGPLWPRETLDLLRRKGWPTVRGNHDRLIASDNPATLGPSDRYAREQLDSGGIAWLGALPVELEIATGILGFHARPGDDESYLLEEQWGERLVRSDPGTIRTRLADLKADLILTAHSHQPHALKLPDGPWLLNPGSVGCPAYRDESSDPPHASEQGSPAARYAIVETGAVGPTIELLIVPYSHDRAAQRALANGRPEWAYALRTGFMLRESSHR